MFEIERAPIPIRIVVEDVLEILRAEPLRFRPADAKSPPELRPQCETRKDKLACTRMGKRTRDCAGRFDLCRCQARSRFLAFAFKALEIETAPCRVID